MIKLTEGQLERLIWWYGRTVLFISRSVGSDDEYFFDNGLIEPMYVRIRFGALVGGYVLTSKAKRVVRRRASLRLVCDLLSRVNETMNASDLYEIVTHIPFDELPQLLACENEYIQMLAARRVRKAEVL